jgi:DNA-binding GntR family transcriptional regulator
MSADQIADALETDIVGGAYHPGEELKQGKIADQFSVSRIPVRDALQLLAARGVIELVPNRRARVISLSASEIDEVYALRILLESDCLRQSIQNMTDIDIGAIERALAHSDIDAKTARWADSDWEFHESLYRPSKRPRQLAMIESLRKTCRIHIAGYGILPSRTEGWLEDHARLLDACRSRSENQAVNILTRHIEYARETLMSALPGTDSAPRGPA